MSSVLGVTKDLMWSKFKLMNMILLFDLLEVLVLIFIGVLKLNGAKQGKARLSILLNYSEGVLIFSACVVYLIGVLLLIRSNEQVFSNDRYRLIPLSEMKLYFINLVTTSLAYCYLVISATGIFILASYTQMKSDIFLHFIIWNSNELKLLVKDGVITMLGIILIWTCGTLIHLLVDYLSNFLSTNKRKLTFVIMNFLILGLSMGIIFVTLTRMSLIDLDDYRGLVAQTFFKVCFFDLAGIGLSIIGSLHLLQNYFETSR